MADKIIRKIVDIKSETSITGRQRWVETLECGHRNVVYSKSRPIVKRRYCFHLDCVKAEPSWTLKTALEQEVLRALAAREGKG